MVSLPPSLQPKHLDYLQRLQAQAYRATLAGERLTKKIVKVLEGEFRAPAPCLIRPGKRLSRALRKVTAVLQNDPAKTVEQAIDLVKDWASGRFLILHLEDVAIAHQVCCDFIKKNQRAAKLDGDPQDYNAAPKESGYRGLHQGIMIKIGTKEWFPFELQFLTFLQADWAYKEHLVYENPNKYSAQVKDKLKNLSDQLHQVACNFDALRSELNQRTG
jgi:ppGpp synthetase/RelA/SpoT-type nucleotidyltranferase